MNILSVNILSRNRPRDIHDLVTNHWVVRDLVCILPVRHFGARGSHFTHDRRLTRRGRFVDHSVLQIKIIKETPEGF